MSWNEHPIAEDPTGETGSAPGPDPSPPPDASVSPGGEPADGVIRSVDEMAADEGAAAIGESGAAVAGVALDPAGVPARLFVPPPPPRPKPVIIPERTEKGFRTAGISIELAGSGSSYITIRPTQGEGQTIYVRPAALQGLLGLAAMPALEPGKLWQALSAIPIERPLPSRILEEELRVLLTRFATDLRS